MKISKIFFDFRHLFYFYLFSFHKKTLEKHSVFQGSKINNSNLLSIKYQCH